MLPVLHTAYHTQISHDRHVFPPYPLDRPARIAGVSPKPQRTYVCSLYLRRSKTALSPVILAPTCDDLLRISA